MEFEFIDFDSFKSSWRKIKKNSILSEELNLNPKFLRETDDFKRYFPELIDLSKKYGFISNIPVLNTTKKLGGVFQLDNVKYHIIIKERGRQQITMGISTDNMTSLDFMIPLLNTLTYVFCLFFEI